TGPFLRATGVAYDLRKAAPYDVYDRMEFDIPVGDNGDTYDRWLVRLEEARQSRRIIEQALAQIPPGPFIIEDPRFVLPPKDDVYTSIEGLMNHFKLVIEAPRCRPAKSMATPKAATASSASTSSATAVVSLTSAACARRASPPCSCSTPSCCPEP